MITYLKMVNWRAYDQREVHFKKGITFLMGANGTGKTSMLEAISYALTGEAALFKRSDRAQLLRDLTKPGTITLRFEVQGTNYEIQRTQTPDHAGDAIMVSLSDQKKLARTHTSITTQVEKLLGVSAEFLRRIIYMPEGEVFSFLNAPPKRALDGQIRAVIGLVQLDEFAAALKASEKFFKGRLKSLQELNADLTRLEVRSMDELESKLNAGEMAKKQILDQLDQIGREIGAIEQSQNALSRLKNEVDNVSKMVRSAPDQWRSFTNAPLLSYFDKLQELAHDAESHAAEIAFVIARLDGQDDAFQRVLSLLEPYQDSNDTVPCPVCQKPLTLSERQSILETIREDIEALNQERQHQLQRKQSAQNQTQTLHVQVSQLQSLRNILVYSEVPDIHPAQPFDKIANSIANLTNEGENKKIAELNEKQKSTRQFLTDVESHQSEYQAIQKRINDFNYRSPEELDDEIVRIEIRMLSIRAALQATEATLRDQQDTDMRIVYEQIADLWSSFRDEEGWGVKFNVDGYPVICNSDMEMELDLRQLSGGEKTALLVMLHTIIAHHFSKSDFLMIDEPLEHLDPINRRSLIRFLVDAYRHNIFGQAIIATFEESLVRKYQSTDGVNIVLA
ncbi:MAG: AAA family ATPase [Chloroflexota bacterium]